MTERLADMGARIAGVRQLGAVVNAMRGIAAARARQARGQLVAVDSYAAIIAAAIGRTLALVPPSSPHGAPDARGQIALVLFCAEQGFAGAFSERVLDAAGALDGTALFLIGTRGMAAATARGIKAEWTAAMPSHSPGIPKLADAIAEALYAWIARQGAGNIDVVFTNWQPGYGTTIDRRHLLPFDPSSFLRPTNPNVPLLNLAPAKLVSSLTAEYLHAELCKAALHAFAGENEARMESMAAAHNQIDRQLSALQATERMVRQEEITAEIIELAAGETASRDEIRGTA